MTTKRILVLGIGNILWADEGFGVRCVEALNAGWQFPPQVTLMDGGTQGLYLLPYVQEAACWSSTRSITAMSRASCAR
jgi:hydrogenase maturation protease